MNFKYFILPVFLLFLGAGCEQAKPDVVPQPATNPQPVVQIPKQDKTEQESNVRSVSPWRLSFDLPSGWRYGGEADWNSPVPAEKLITKKDDRIYLVNTTRRFFASGGAAPDWGMDANAANKTNAIALSIIYAGPAGNFGKGSTGTKIATNLYRWDVLQDENCQRYGAEYCSIPGTNGITYSLKVGTKSYAVEMHTIKKDAATLRLAEEILKTAKEN